MFTGIVEEQGHILAAETHHTRDNTLTIAARTALIGTAIGDSISVSGVCLTVTHLTDASFTVGLSPETLRCTNLGELRAGSTVNLERALTYGGRMGGIMCRGTSTVSATSVQSVPKVNRSSSPSHPLPSCLPTS